MRRFSAMLRILMPLCALGASGCVGDYSGVIHCSVTVGGYLTNGCVASISVNNQSVSNECVQVPIDSNCVPHPPTFSGACHLDRDNLASSLNCVAGYLPSSTVTMCTVCADPLVVEVPLQWSGLRGTWHTGDSADSGLVVIQGTSDFHLADGSTAIAHPDPGMAAYVLSLDAVPPPGVPLRFDFFIDSGGIDNAVVKGIDVMLATFDGVSPTLVPMNAPDLDFRKVVADSTHSLTLGPGQPTRAQRATWGALKSAYR